MKKSRKFTDLITWQKAHEFTLSAYKLTSKFPKNEQFGLTSQMRSAAVSISANISEGFKRIGNKDKLRFYNISQASIEECRYYLILSKDLEYSKDVSKEEFLLEDVSKLLLGLCNSIRRKM